MSHSPKPVPRHRKRSIWLIAALTAGLAIAALASLAAAKSSKPTLKTASNSALSETIVVDSSGMTVYELAPETSKHLLCTSSQCLQFWPPVKVAKSAKLVKAAGVKGRLGRLHRGGFFQLTLDGHPLYHFSGDKAKGQAVGNGIKNFGGTWHVVKGSRVTHSGTTTGTKTTTPTTTSTTTSSSTSSTYSYPGY